MIRDVGIGVPKRDGGFDEESDKRCCDVSMVVDIGAIFGVKLKPKLTW